MKTKQWGFGTIFSLIVVYFIFLYSREKGWAVLAFLSKWYLIIAGGLLALSLSIIILIMLFSLFVFIVAYFKLRSFKKKAPKQHHFVDVDYKLKE